MKDFTYFNKNAFASLIGTLALLSPPPAYAKSALFYRINPKDTLTDILFQLNLIPLYGPKGSLQATLRSNPHKISTGGHSLRPGERIQIPSEFEKDLPIHAEITAEGEVLLKEQPRRTVTATVTAPVTVPVAVAASASPVESLPPAGKSAPEEPSPDHHYDFGVETVFNSLSAKDPSSGGSAVVNLKSGWAFQAGWKVLWSETFATFAEWKGSWMEYSPSNNVLKGLENRSLQRHALSLGAEHVLQPRLRLKYILGYGSEVFLYGVSSNVIRLDVVPLTSLRAQMDYEFLKKGSTSLSAQMEGQYLLGQDTETYRVDSGSRISGAFALSQDFVSPTQRKNLHLTIGVRNREQNTTVIQQSEEEIFALLQLLFYVRGEP